MIKLNVITCVGVVSERGHASTESSTIGLTKSIPANVMLNEQEMLHWQLKVMQSMQGFSHFNLMDVGK